jgi:hypothetical protein
MTHKIFDMPFARIYPLYVAKVTKKGRSVEELINSYSGLLVIMKIVLNEFLIKYF